MSFKSPCLLKLFMLVFCCMYISIFVFCIITHMSWITSSQTPPAWSAVLRWCLVSQIMQWYISIPVWRPKRLMSLTDNVPDDWDELRNEIETFADKFDMMGHEDVDDKWTCLTLYRNHVLINSWLINGHLISYIYSLK